MIYRPIGFLAQRSPTTLKYTLLAENNPLTMQI
jgi:hypothetical protein